MNRSLFSTLNAVADITGYMIHGVFSNWKDMTFSNVGKRDGKKSGKSTGMHCIEFFFLFPLVSGTFANRQKYIFVDEMMTEDTKSILLQIWNVFQVSDRCHINDVGKPKFPKCRFLDTSFQNTVEVALKKSAVECRQVEE